MTITLTDAEIRLAKFIGKARYEAARAANVVDARVDDSRMDLDTDGFAAELALCRLLNVYPDLTIGPRQGGHDLVWGGFTIDVKQTTYENGHLVATLTKADRSCEMYALMTGTLPTFTFRGFATKEQLCAAQNVRDLGRGKGYVLEQSKLITDKDIRWS